MNWQKLQTVEVWLKGLIAAGISAGASVPGVMIVDPAKFNLHGGLGSVLEAAGITAFVAMSAYLAKSPLPGVIGNKGA